MPHVSIYTIFLIACYCKCLLIAPTFLSSFCCSIHSLSKSSISLCLKYLITLRDATSPFCIAKHTPSSLKQDQEAMNGCSVLPFYLCFHIWSLPFHLTLSVFSHFCLKWWFDEMFSCVAIIVNDVVVSIHTKSKCNKQFFSSINDGLVNRGILLFIYHQEINANIILILFHVDKYTTIQTTVIETCYLRNKTSVHVFNGRIKYKYEFRYDLITCIGMSTYIYRCTET